MSPFPWTQSPAWLTVGWIMLHFLWLGVAIGLVAGVGRLLLRSAGPGMRYGWALACFAALALAPIGIATFLVSESPPSGAVSLIKATPMVQSNSESPHPVTEQLLPAFEPTPTPSLLGWAAGHMPWLWLFGTPLCFVMLMSGLVGTERLRGQSENLSEGEIVTLCRRLAVSLGIGRIVGVGICRRISSPILLGIIRPLILLPPAALTGWSAAQLEMVLLHELAHVRRFDSLVNLVQRTVEALLFFHPVVWWLSAWIRLERELGCDEIVVRQTGRPHDYAQILASLAGPVALPKSALAMSEHNLVTRIRCILKLEDRSMKISTKTLVLLAAVVVGAAIGLHLYAQPTQAPADDPRPDPLNPVPFDDKKELPSKGVLEEIPYVGEFVKQGQSLGEAGEKSKAPDSLTLVGRVEAAEQINVHARVSGSVDNVAVDSGDRVKKGQVLATLAVPEIELELRQKKALLTQAKVEIDLVRRSVQAARSAVDSLKLSIRAAEADLNVAKAKYAISQAELEEAEKAHRLQQVGKNAVLIARSHLEAAKALQAVAEAKIEAAKANVQESEAKQARTETTMRVAEAKLEIAEADLQGTELRLQSAQIRAPIDGVVIDRRITVGGFASINTRDPQPLFVIARTDSVRIVVYVPEANIGQLRKGAPVAVQVDAYPKRTFQGKLVRLAPTVEGVMPLARRIRVEIELANPDARLLPGMTARAVFSLQ